MLLLYPPITKACEPPGGLPLLGGVLNSHGINYEIIDMNCEGQNYLLEIYFKEYPKKRYYRDLITNDGGYKKRDTYVRIIKELEKGLNYKVDNDYKLSLSNLSSSKYDSLSSKDLLNVYENYHEDPFYKYYEHRLVPILEKGKIEFIGISLQFINQALTTFALIGFIKNKYPDIKIILGGGLITSWGKTFNWEKQLSSIVDKVIIGPGESQLVEYLGYTPDRDKIKSSIPDYHFVKKLKYFSPVKIIPVSASYGCSWKKCSFCPEVAEDNPFIPQKTLDVIRKIKELVSIYKPDLIHFLDNEISPTLLKALSVSETKVSWYGFTKFYSLLKDYEFCKKLKKAGCCMLKLGLESGDQKILDSMNKGIDIKDASIILRNLANAGILTYVYLLFGTPEEDYESAMKTKDFILNHSDSIDYLNLAIFNLPANSSQARNLKVFNISDSDLSLYKGFKHPKGWDRGKVREFISNELNSEPRINNILKKTPLQFNANHAPFFSK